MSVNPLRIVKIFFSWKNKHSQLETDSEISVTEKYLLSKTQSEILAAKDSLQPLIRVIDIQEQTNYQQLSSAEKTQVIDKYLKNYLQYPESYDDNEVINQIMDTHPIEQPIFITRNS